MKNMYFMRMRKDDAYISFDGWRHWFWPKRSSNFNNLTYGKSKLHFVSRVVKR